MRAMRRADQPAVVTCVSNFRFNGPHSARQAEHSEPETHLFRFLTGERQCNPSRPTSRLPAAAAAAAHDTPQAFWTNFFDGPAWDGQPCFPPYPWRTHLCCEHHTSQPVCSLQIVLCSRRRRRQGRRRQGRRCLRFDLLDLGLHLLGDGRGDGEGRGARNGERYALLRLCPLPVPEADFFLW